MNSFLALWRQMVPLLLTATQLFLGTCIMLTNGASFWGSVGCCWGKWLELVVGLYREMIGRWKVLKHHLYRMYTIYLIKTLGYIVLKGIYLWFDNIYIYTICWCIYKSNMYIWCLYIFTSLKTLGTKLNGTNKAILMQFTQYFYVQCMYHHHPIDQSS